MKKKKVILAVLASLCVAASSVGITACSGGGSTQDPALYAAYQTYASSTDDPMTYEQWVAYVLDQIANNNSSGEDSSFIEEVNSITINGKKYFEFKFTSGRLLRLAVDGSDRQETTAFNIKAVDQAGSPVADVYFSIGYMDDGYMHHYVRANGTISDTGIDAAVAKTDENGVAIFNIFLSDDTLPYSVYIADSNAISDGGNVRPVPSGFLDNYFGTDALGFANVSAPFTKNANGNYSINLTFNMNNGWSAGYNSRNDLNYRRYVKNLNNPDDITEEYTPYVKSVSKNKNNYFTLSPYYDVRGTDQEANEALQNAASGIYRVSWSADNPDANVALTLYSFFDGLYFIRNDDGSPAEVLVAARSGENNYVDVEVAFDNAFQARCLGFVADMDCTVTIEVERLSDVPTWYDQYVEATVPASATKADEVDGRVIDVPFTATVVKGGDGNYHLNNANGPLIYVQLKKGTRANTSSIVDLCHYTVEGGPSEPGASGSTTTMSRFSDIVTEVFDPLSNAGMRTHTNYTAALERYGELANSDGLYPVNDQIKAVLDVFCTDYIGWTQYRNTYWLAACSYYGEPSDGSENSPYDLTTGNNTVDLNGKTYVAIKSNTTGYYVISTSNGELDIPNSIVINGSYYVEVHALEEFKFTITGNGTATVNVATVNTRVIEFAYTSQGDATVIVGNEDNPISITSGAGVYQVNINHDVSNNQPISVQFGSLLSAGNYRITVYGSSTATVVDLNNDNLIGGTISVDYSSPARFRVDDVKDGTFFLLIESIT